MTPVQFEFKTPEGDPLAGVEIEIQLSKSSFNDESTGILMPRLVTATTDVDGKVTVELWPSDALYYVKVLDDETEAGLSYKFLVPTMEVPGPVRLQDIVIVGEMSETTYDEEALQAIADSKAHAVTAQLAAAASATAASSSQAAAAASATTAGNQAGIATTQAGNAQASASASDIARAAAVVAKTAAETAANDAQSVVAVAVRHDLAQSLGATAQGVARANIGLNLVENKTSATIRGEISSGNVTTALGYTPYNATNPAGYLSEISSLLVTAALGFTPVNAAAVGAANGIVPLDSTGKIAALYLPGFVDELIEATDLASFPGTGEAGKMYVALDTNKVYRWGGSTYVEMSGSPGSTDAVAEGSVNRYWTNARTIGSVLTGLSTETAGAIASTDTVLQALGKLEATKIANTVNSLTPAGGTLAVTGGGTFTGNLSVTGIGLFGDDTAHLRFGKLDSNAVYLQGKNAAGDAAKAIVFYGLTEYGRFDISGNLGIGVAPSAAWTAAGQKAIQWPALMALSNGYDYSAALTMNAVRASGGAWQYLQSGQPASKYEQSNGGHTWFSAPSGTAGSAISFTQAMALDASGNLSASGTVSSGSGFQTTTYTSSARNRIWSFGNNLPHSDGVGISFFQGSSGHGGNDSIGFHFGTATAGASTLNVLNDERGVAVSGQVFVGMHETLNSTHRGLKFRINGNTDDFGGVTMEMAIGEVRYTAGFLGWGGYHTWYGNGALRMSLDGSGNLGVGTGSPDRRLVVNGDIGFSYNSTVSGNGIRRNGVATEYFNAITSASADIIHKFTGAGGVTKMQITEGGELQIGTNSPRYGKLVVGGDVWIIGSQLNAEPGLGQNFAIVNRDGAGLDFYVDGAAKLAARLDGSGVLNYGTYTGTPGTITGYIEIKDIGGTVRKLAVIS